MGSSTMVASTLNRRTRWTAVIVPRESRKRRLIVGPDGKRLAKRHGDSRISSYKTQGVTSERIIGLIANWCGIATTLEPMNLDSFLQNFTLMHLPTTNITFSQKEELWLRD